MWLFALFIGVPLIEIALFIQVGGVIGLGWTLLIVVITAILGTYLVRQQGLRAIGDVQRSFSELRDPTEPLAHGLMILFSGALLLTPGFFTDAVGFSLLMPQVRVALFQFIRSRMKVQSFTMGNGPQPGKQPSDVIDGDFEEVEPPKNPNQNGPGGQSGWTKH
jgi:UPF0716 protein FxsA